MKAGDPIPYDEATKKLPRRGNIHTFRQLCMESPLGEKFDFMIGIDLPRDEVKKLMKSGVFKSGPEAERMEHGMFVRRKDNDVGEYPMFIETKE